MEKIEAMEVVGATILLNITRSRNRPFPKAFEYWRRVHQLRQMEIKGSPFKQREFVGYNTRGCPRTRENFVDPSKKEFIILQL